MLLDKILFPKLAVYYFPLINYKLLKQTISLVNYNKLIWVIKNILIIKLELK